MTEIKVKKYPAPLIDKREILRYAGDRSTDGEIEQTLDEVIKSVESAADYRVCSATFPLQLIGDSIEFATLKIQSASLARHLSGADEIILFAATIGVGADRIISRNFATSSYRGLLADAAATERIEALADAFCADIAKDLQKTGKISTSRFSPGYGDFDITWQKEILLLLDSARKIGVTLNDSLLMSPMKSVSAVIGVKRI